VREHLGATVGSALRSRSACRYWRYSRSSRSWASRSASRSCSPRSPCCSSRTRRPPGSSGTGCCAPGRRRRRRRCSPAGGCCACWPSSRRGRPCRARSDDRWPRSARRRAVVGAPPGGARRQSPGAGHGPSRTGRLTRSREGSRRRGDDSTGATCRRACRAGRRSARPRNMFKRPRAASTRADRRATATVRRWECCQADQWPGPWRAPDRRAASLRRVRDGGPPRRGWATWRRTLSDFAQRSYVTARMWPPLGRCDGCGGPTEGGSLWDRLSQRTARRLGHRSGRDAHLGRRAQL
jgi:hypothetical protein